VDIIQAVYLEHRRAPHVVVEVGVAAVDDRIALGQQRDQRVNHLLGDVAGRQHNPDRARGLELADQLLDGVGGLGALGSQLVERPMAAVMRDDTVPAAQPALGHTGAHAPKTGYPDVHNLAPSCLYSCDMVDYKPIGWGWRMRARIV